MIGSSHSLISNGGYDQNNRPKKVFIRTKQPVFDVVLENNSFGDIESKVIQVEIFSAQKKTSNFADN